MAKRHRKKWGRIGAPHSAKRRRHLRRIAPRGGRASHRRKRRHRRGNPGDPRLCGYPTRD